MHPELVTSAIPVPEENRPPQAPPPQKSRRDLAAEEAERVAEAVRQEQSRPFYDRGPEVDREYDYASPAAAEEAFKNVMGSALEPFKAPGPSSDIEHPTNQPSDRGARAWNNGPQRALIACQPKAVLKKGQAPSAGVVARLPIGTMLSVVVDEEPLDENAEADIPVAPAKPSKTPPKVWAHVDAGENRRGWVDEAMTREVNMRDASEAYLTCCGAIRDGENESASAKERFVVRADYVACLQRGLKGAAEAPPSLALEHTMAVARTAELVDKAQTGVAPYKSFVNLYGGQLAWTPEGYVLKSSELWSLEEKFHGTPSGEGFAWRAAHEGAMDRTCNREVICNVLQARARYGEYLRRYPNGPHAREAIDVIIALRPRDENDPSVPIDRNAQSVDQGLRAISDMFAIVDSTRAVGRVQASGALEALRRFVIARSGRVEGRR